MGRRRHVVVVLLLLLLLQLVPRILASTAATHGNGEPAITKERGSLGAMMRQTLGSRPPSCEGQCRWACGGRRCEAVQVPVTPRDLGQELKKRKKEKRASPAAGRGGGTLLPSSYDEHSNYKPLGWRCKCLHS